VIPSVPGAADPSPFRRQTISGGGQAHLHEERQCSVGEREIEPSSSPSQQLAIRSHPPPMLNDDPEQRGNMIDGIGP
jgi:hypothetical protein